MAAGAPKRLVLGSILLVLLFATLGLGGCGGTAQSLNLVRLDSGLISGSHEGSLWIFRGIPYAAPPVGDLRWKPPQPVKPWTQARACTTFGPSCPQPSAAEGEIAIPSVGPTSEDCLYLNVWSPAKTPAERLPVMFFIHGGSFTTGSGSMALYDGAKLAQKGVVVVTINYRLGPFGFLALPALSKESPQGSSGNYGLLDQIAALHWVQRNISAFGGDPSKVTVFGESAGAISILDLMVISEAKGLFRAAIAESPILLDKGFGIKTNRTLAEAQSAGEEFARTLGVQLGNDEATELRRMTADQLLAGAQGQPGLTELGLRWSPVVDGSLLPDLPTVLWGADKELHIPLMIGSNRDEGNAFLSAFPGQVSGYDSAMGNIFGAYAPQVLALFPAADDAQVKPAFSRALTELGFAATARFAAQTEASSGVAASYLYQFSRAPLGDTLGAFHGIELPYVFGTAGLFTSLVGQVAPQDQALSNTIMGYWTRFAVTGDPNGDGAVVWPKYERATDQYLELGATVSAKAGLFKEACDLADQIRAH